MSGFSKTARRKFLKAASGAGIDVSMSLGDLTARDRKLFLDGKKAEAMAAVPESLIDDVALVGPWERIKDRLGAWKEAGKQGHVGTMLIGGARPDGLRKLAEEIL